MNFSTKTLTIASVIGISGLVLSGCSFPGQSANQNGTATQQQNQQEAQQMAAAIQNGQPAYCLMTKPGTNEKIEYWVKNKKMRMMGTGISNSDDSAEMMGNMISDGEYIYVWGEGQSTGVKMKIPTEEEQRQSQERYQEYMDKIPSEEGNYEQHLESEYQDQGYTVNCQSETIGDDQFMPPTSITFTDMAVMMKAMPSAPVMNEDDQAAFEEMMKQYQVQGQ